MIPVLIHWAQYSWESPHYYCDLSKAVGHTTNQIGKALGWVHDIIHELSEQSHREIPTLNSLVISKSTNKPSDGFSYVLTDYADISEDEQTEQASRLRLLAHRYDWNWVLRSLSLEPYSPPVSYWILPSNNAKYRINDYLTESDILDWSQHNNFSEGDIAFLYCSSPDSCLRYMFRIIRTDLTSSESIDDRVYWSDPKDYDAAIKNNRFIRLKLISQLPDTDDRLSIQVLKRIGIKSFQGVSILKDQTAIDAILNVFNINCDFDSDLFDSSSSFYYEGTKRQVTVNSYERDPKARKQCIKIHGTTCAVCGIDFEKQYGELGRGFIHVHHVVPIHTIGKDYKVNPDTDLIPVCPNCHAMLHRGLNNGARTIDELKLIMSHKD